MTGRLRLAITAGVCLSMTPLMARAQPAPYSPALQPVQILQVVGDAIPEPLTSTPADAKRGRALVVNRQAGLCLLCHTGPFPEERFQGNLAPDLAGAGSRWSAGQLRLRLADAKRFNPQTIMPAYYRIDGLTQVAPAFKGKPLMSTQDIEDVIAFLQSLKD